jgi:brefeldin A-inhibited guanine nucleotide-exchange protein
MSLADAHQFETHISTFYPLATDLLLKEVAPEMRSAIREYLCRVGVAKGIMREGR